MASILAFRGGLLGVQVGEPCALVGRGPLARLLGGAQRHQLPAQLFDLLVYAMRVRRNGGRGGENEDQQKGGAAKHRGKSMRFSPRPLTGKDQSR